MRHLLMRVTLAVTAAAVIGPVQAQTPPAAVAPPHPSYPGGTYQSYPFAPTPEDAYRDGNISRWEFQQIAGPLPQALQGPSVDGSRGGSNGGDKGG